MKKSEQAFDKVRAAYHEFKEAAEMYKYLKENEELVSSCQTWVSVKERMPEHGESVLMWGETYFPRTGMFYVNHFRSDGVSVTWVTHWMPLPEPPKSKEVFDPHIKYKRWIDEFDKYTYEEIDEIFEELKKRRK